jgi:hypothetical protein
MSWWNPLNMYEKKPISSIYNLLKGMRPSCVLLPWFTWILGIDLPLWDFLFLICIRGKEKSHAICGKICWDLGRGDYQKGNNLSDVVPVICYSFIIIHHFWSWVCSGIPLKGAQLFHFENLNLHYESRFLKKIWKQKGNYLGRGRRPV